MKWANTIPSGGGGSSAIWTSTGLGRAPAENGAGVDPTMHPNSIRRRRTRGEPRARLSTVLEMSDDRESRGERDDARFVALTEELGTQLRRMRGAGPKLTQLLSMVQLQRPSGDAPARPLGTLIEHGEPLRFRAVGGLIEQDLDTR